MCLGIPARVVSVSATRAVLDLQGRKVVADASLVPVLPGDFVLVQAGLIVQALSRGEAEEILRTLVEVMAGSTGPS